MAVLQRRRGLRPSTVVDDVTCSTPSRPLEDALDQVLGDDADAPPPSRCSRPARTRTSGCTATRGWPAASTAWSSRRGRYSGRLPMPPSFAQPLDRLGGELDVDARVFDVLVFQLRIRQRRLVRDRPRHRLELLVDQPRLDELARRPRASAPRTPAPSSGTDCPTRRGCPAAGTARLWTFTYFSAYS